MTNEVLNSKHELWGVFMEALNGVLGIHMEEDSWRCNHSWRFSLQILRAFGPRYGVALNAPKTLTFFEEHGGFCDCGVLFNLLPEDDLPKLSEEDRAIAKEIGLAVYFKTIADSAFVVERLLQSTIQPAPEWLDVLRALTLKGNAKASSIHPSLGGKSGPTRP